MNETKDKNMEKKSQKQKIMLIYSQSKNTVKWNISKYMILPDVKNQVEIYLHKYNFDYNKNGYIP